MMTTKQTKLLGGLLAATSVLGILLFLTRNPTAPARKPYWVQGLAFDANSCHIDSLLFAIFAFPGPLVDLLMDAAAVNPEQIPCSPEQRLEIRAELKRILEAMHQPKPTNYTCANLRLLFGRCQRLQAAVQSNINEPGVLQDPKDTLELLRKVFPALDQTSIMTSQTKRFLVANNQLNPAFPPTSTVNPNTVFTINLVDVPGMANQVLSKSLRPGPYPLGDENIEYGVTEYKFQVPYLVFDVQRLRFRNNDILEQIPETLDTVIIPDDKLDIAQVESVIHPETPLKLQSIVSYAGWPHYVAFTRNPATGTWYYYNDIGKPPIKRVGSYEQLLGFQHGLVSKLGVLFFYW